MRIRRIAPASAAADIYALGVVMYEMITGSRPCPGSTPRSVAALKLAKHPRSPREFAPGVPRVVESAILRCLAANPQDRFRSADEVAAALASSRSVVPGLPLHTRKLAACVLAAILLLAGGFSLKALISTPPQHTPPIEAVRWYREGVDALAEGAYLKASNLLQRAVSIDDRYIVAHARLAEAYAELDMSDKAKDEVIRARSLAPDRSRIAGQEARLLDATQFTVAREFRRAQQAYRELVENTSGTDKARAYLDLGRASERAYLTGAAVEAYRRAAESSPWRDAALLHLGRLSARQGNAAVAIGQLKEAQELFQLGSNYEGVTEARIELARIYESSNVAAAEAETRSALELTRLTSNPQQEVKARFALSRVKLLQGYETEAAAIAEEAIAAAERLHLDNLSVQGLNDVAAVLTRKLRWKEVEATCLRAIRLARRSRSRAGEARALFFLGQAYMQLNDYTTAIRYLQEAEPWYREGGDSHALQSVLALQADVLCGLGRYSEAKAAADRMRQWAEAHGDTHTLILAAARSRAPRLRG